MPPDPRSAPSLGQRVEQARADTFVGRREEIAIVERGIRGVPEAPSVFLIHGPGGIGKTTLLRRIAELARQQGRAVVELDGRTLGRSTKDFETAAAQALAQDRPVLLVDTFEQIQWLETWLRERFLARLAEGTVVVLAGRETPDLEWSVDPGWSRIVAVLELPALDRADAETLLSTGGLAPAQRDGVIRFAGGNPLVLSLALAVASTTASEETAWAPPVAVIQTLVARLVGMVPSPAHRKALHVAALAFLTDESLLAAVLPDEDTAALFGWLATLPFIDTVDGGLHPHEAAREALVADLRWRSGHALDQMSARLTSHLLKRVRAASQTAALPAMAELFYVHRTAPRIAGLYTWERRGQVESDVFRPADLVQALELTRRVEGDESAAIVRHWYARQPESFRIHRSIDTGEVVAFGARLILGSPDDMDTSADPVAAAAWHHVLDTEPLASGQHIAIRRFTVRDSVAEASAAVNLMSWQSLADICRSSRLAHAFVVYPDADSGRTWLGAASEQVGTSPVVDGHPHVLFVNDWRYLTFEEWLDQAVGAQQPSAAPAAVELTREDFDSAVRQVLALWRHKGGIGGSRLRATPLVPADSPDVDTAIRAVVREAVQDMRGDRRTLRGHDAIVATYFSGAGTQRAAAHRIGIPFSTYRRHLQQGVTELSERLWNLAHRRSA